MIENDFVEIEFRDGRHAVPAHLAALIVSVPDTWTLTYEEAIAAVNRMALTEHLNKIQREVVSEHMVRLRRQPWE